MERWFEGAIIFYREKLRKSERAKRLMLLFAFAAFLAGIVFSIFMEPDAFTNIAWEPMVIVLLVTVPFSILANSLEYYLLARQIGLPVSLAYAVEVTIISSAANMLPLPGGALVRIAALRKAGASYRGGVGATLLGAIIWIGVSFVIAGGGVASMAPGFVAMSLIVLGILALVAGLILSARTRGGLRIGALVVLNRTITVIITAARFYFCLIAIGYLPSYAQAAALTVSGVAGSAISIVPAGLGVRELVAAALAPVVLMPPAIGFLAASLSRVLGLVALLPVSLFLAFRHRGSPKAETL